MENLKYKIAIGLIPYVGSITAKNLISYTGSIEAVFSTSRQKLMKIPNVGKLTADSIIKNRKKAIERAENEISFIEQNKINTYFYLDKDFPELLKHCPDAPLMLFSKGNLNLNGRKILAVIGTRKASPEGKENCRNLIKSLAEKGHNPIIVSGLAYGIDICAHKAALENNLDTIAVMGHGLNQIYPPAHKNIAKEIIKNGGTILTEFLSDSTFYPKNFVQRNRIVAGMSIATIVVESAIKGGSLSTADIANSYSREVFAFPGRVNDLNSQGCNKLIKQHKAYLIENANDIEYVLGWEKSKPQATQSFLFYEFTEDEKIIVRVLAEFKNPAIDKICRESKFSMGKVSTILLELEFKNAVRSLPGKVYELAGAVNVENL